MTLQSRTTILIAVCLPVSVAQAERWFVDAQLSTGADTGASWMDAFQGPLGLQAALAVAQEGDEVWVAAGTYLPAGDGNRALSFEPAARVALYGGFAGTETRLGQRDWALHPVILSGDLNADDGPGFSNRGDNTHHVLRIVVEGVILDGFTVRGGMVSDELDGSGGGLEIVGVLDLVVRNCTVVDSEAQQGGAIFVGGSALFENCVIARNRATGNALASGGGVHVAIDLLPRIQPVFVNCLFSGNVAALGGGIIGDHSFYTLTNCTVVANQSTVSNFGAGALLEGTFGSLTITNCVLWGNEAIGSTSELAQLWTPNLASFLHLNHTCIQSYAGTLQTDGSGNFGDAPMFVDELGGDRVAGSGDEDYRLSAGSPSIDRGINAALPPDVVTDLAGQPRRVDDPATMDQGIGSPPIVDVGAFEFSPDSPVPALSPAGLVACSLLLSIAAAVVITRRRPSTATPCARPSSNAGGG